MNCKRVMDRFSKSTNRQRGATTVEYALVVVLCVAVLITAVLKLADPTASLDDPDGNYFPQVYNSIHTKIDRTDTVEGLRD